MADVPRAVLSEHFQERMGGRRLRSAVFLTFQFDAGFFEQQVLPVFLDVGLSHAAEIRLVQLEDALRSLPGQVAVYYDADGLVSGGEMSAKLDVRRIAMQHRRGIFHPKNVFLLVEDEAEGDDGYRPQTLLIASLSANLTQTGWWENVEACHVEEVQEGDRTRLKGDVAAFLELVRRKVPEGTDQSALEDVLAFLQSVRQRKQKSTGGELHTHFYAGRESLPDFLERVAGRSLRGCHLEVISPYLDQADECRPLEALLERFTPRATRVYLPRAPSGEVLCSKEMYEAVVDLPGVGWGRLPKDFIKLGSSEDAGERFVHAKVYRFFSSSPKREICFVGSANLTRAAHQTGGNMESGFLVDTAPPRRPEFWLAPEERVPNKFKPRSEDEPVASTGGTRLNLRYRWDLACAEVYWHAPGPSPELRLEARGLTLGTVPPLPSRTWVSLEPEQARRVAEALEETSLFTVHGEGDGPAWLLVQEEGMSHKPSLLLRLSAADILRYWSLLTPDQRTAFLEARAPELALTGQGADLVARARIALDHDTVFDRFAGFFHAFGCLERAARKAIESGHTRDAEYRLFGNKYDSLSSLLDRVASEEAGGDPVDHYVIVMCAKQLCAEIRRSYPDYWKQHTTGARALEARFRDLRRVRERLIAENDSEFEAFLTWFDWWFVQRAQVAEVDA